VSADVLVAACAETESSLASWDDGQRYTDSTETSNLQQYE
jgi:hypothetical protein